MENILNELSSHRIPLIRLYSSGWAIFRKKMSTFLGIVFIMNIVSVLLQTIGRPERAQTLLLCGYVLLELVASLFVMASYGAVVFLVEQTLKDKPVNIRSCIILGFSRLWAMFAAAWISIFPILFLAGVAYFIFRFFYIKDITDIPILPSLAIILLVACGIAWWGYVGWAVYAATLRVNGWKAVGYSIKLVNNQWWSLFGIILGMGILSNPIGTILIGLLDLVVYWQARLFIFPLQMMLACYTNFNLIVTTVLYLNLDYLKNPPLLFEDDHIPSDTLIGETAIS